MQKNARANLLIAARRSFFTHHWPPFLIAVRVATTRRLADDRVMLRVADRRRVGARSADGVRSFYSAFFSLLVFLRDRRFFLANNLRSFRILELLIFACAPEFLRPFFCCFICIYRRPRSVASAGGACAVASALKYFHAERRFECTLWRRRRTRGRASGALAWRVAMKRALASPGRLANIAALISAARPVRNGLARAFAVDGGSRRTARCSR